MSQFPPYILPRQYAWAHDIVHVTAGYVMGWEPLAITANKLEEGCWFANHPVPIVRAAPYIALHARDLDEKCDKVEHDSVYPNGCDHPLSFALTDKAYFALVWRAVKRHWRGNLLMWPMSCPCIREAAKTLEDMYVSIRSSGGK